MHSTAARLAGAVALAAAFAACGAPEPAAPPAATAAAPSVEEQRDQFVRWYASQPRLDINLSKEGAQVLILKFNDFQCPPCKTTHESYTPVIKKLVAKHPGAIRYRMVDYPLEPECNKYVGIGPHAAACEAAAAVRLAWEHGTQDRMIDWLFANQSTLTPASVRQAALDVGGVNDYDAKYRATLEHINGDIELGHYLEVKQTPTFFINGVTLEGNFAPEYFEAAILYELEHAAQG